MSIEERLSLVENDLVQIKRRIEETNPAPQDAQWWRNWLGAFKDDPDFDSAMMRGEAFRKAQPTPADSNDNVPT